MCHASFLLAKKLKTSRYVQRLDIQILRCH
jgi:hypothetical protein